MGLINSHVLVYEHVFLSIYVHGIPAPYLPCRTPAWLPARISFIHHLQTHTCADHTKLKRLSVAPARNRVPEG